MTNEEIISDFMQKHYTDEKLAALLAHAEDGKLAFSSCCCLIGIPTADHALRGAMTQRPNEIIWDEDFPAHYLVAKYGKSDIKGDPDVQALPGRHQAEVAFFDLSPDKSDEQRCAALIPLIRAEIERREQLRSKSSIPLDSQVVSV